MTMMMITVAVVVVTDDSSRQWRCLTVLHELHDLVDPVTFRRPVTEQSVGEGCPCRHILVLLSLLYIGRQARQREVQGANLEHGTLQVQVGRQASNRESQGANLEHRTLQVQVGRQARHREGQGANLEHRTLQVQVGRQARHREGQGANLEHRTLQVQSESPPFVIGDAANQRYCNI